MLHVFFMEEIRMKRSSTALLAIPLSVSLLALAGCDRPADTSPNTVGTSGTAEPIDDSRINSAVQSKVFASDGLSRRNVEVMTQDGVVTLHGVVETAEIEKHALTVASEVQGVVRVNDELTIDPDWRARVEAEDAKRELEKTKR
jgi:osmotically-inducible protein OsmY